jgi:5'-deoxynucleotidase YfbR-like HD superfamily hydrolase
VHPLAPSPDKIDIDDIAHSLAHQCRFLGHTDGFYSVAQHSVLVSELVPKADALWGLLHDAAEAYLGDLPAPIKRTPDMCVYQAAEERLLAAVAAKFGLAPTLPASVVEADRIVLATEFRDVTTVDDLDWIAAECGFAASEHLWITPWPPAVAEDRFLRRFWELTR